MSDVRQGCDVERSTLPGIVILTHGSLGEALISSTAMIYGPLEDVRALPLNVGDDPDVYRTRLERLLDEMPRETLVMVDLFGGTPSNALMMIAKQRAVFAVSGVSMPMLLEAANLRVSCVGKALLEAVMRSAHEGVVNITGLLDAPSA
jgi:PTS system mannose-specific IIA component